VDSYAPSRNHAHVPNLSLQRQHPALIALGEAIRHARIERGVSQEKLALIAEVDRSYVGRVERGDNNVALLTLLKLAQALDVSLMDLMKEANL
jgi:ribosome-binding protein aMBF1 (putative translation factor)